MKRRLGFWTGLLLALLSGGCHSSKELALAPGFHTRQTVSQSEEGEMIVKKIVEIHSGKELEVKKDRTGKFYQVLRDGNKIVFIIRVNRNLKQPLPDSAMEYTLSFETDNPIRKGEWKDGQLAQIKALYGFHAFHPDSGYYPLKEGSIKILPDSKKETVTIEVNLPGEYGKELNGTYTVRIASKG